MKRTNPEEEVDAAVAVLRRDYLSQVNNWAKDFCQRIQAGEWEDRDEFIESADQEIDGAHRVIYTYSAKIGLLVSENEDYGIEELGVDSFDWSAGIPYSALMYWAFRQDIFEAMERQGCDVDDEYTFEPEEDEED